MGRPDREPDYGDLMVAIEGANRNLELELGREREARKELEATIKDLRRQIKGWENRVRTLNSILIRVRAVLEGAGMFGRRKAIKVAMKDIGERPQTLDI